LITSKINRKFKITTNSKHNYAICAHVLDAGPKAIGWALSSRMFANKTVV